MRRLGARLVPYRWVLFPPPPSSCSHDGGAELGGAGEGGGCGARYTVCGGRWAPFSALQQCSGVTVDASLRTRPGPGALS